MQLHRIMAVAVPALLLTPVLACKCFVDGNREDVLTIYCCGQLGGVVQRGDDCQASSISEHLRYFRDCCGGQSDCDFPQLDEEEQ